MNEQYLRVLLVAKSFLIHNKVSTVVVSLFIQSANNRRCTLSPPYKMGPLRWLITSHGRGMTIIDIIKVVRFLPLFPVDA